MKLPDKLTLAYIEGLTDAEMSRLTTEQAKRVMDHLAMVANKRLERLRKSKQTFRDGSSGSLAEQSPAARGLKQSKRGAKAFTTSKKNLGATSQNYRAKLMKEIARARRFINAKTSQVAGTKELAKEVESRVGEFENAKQASKFWETFKKVLEQHPEYRKSAGGNTNELVAIVYDTMFHKKRGGNRKNPLGATATIREMERILTEGYEAKEGQSQSGNPLSIPRSKKPKGAKSTIHTKFETIYPFGKK